MSDNTKHDIEHIFHEALERPTSDERAAYLDGACGADLHLRTRVDVLLKAHADADKFLEEAAVQPGKASLSEGPGSMIDQFKLLQNIGEGGMGVVYMAEQMKPVRRKVALKIIKLGMDTKQVIARFEVERQALAMMDHPNIAKVLGAGATETGRPYFVMELVRGVAISEYCDTNNLSTRERLGLFIATCHAIQHAHQKGIIHRDIKPSNVLVTSHDGRPVPKIIDFGIAKATNQRLTEMTLFTEFSQFIGTPEYMSPEQAEMSGLDVDTRSDVYSLGVLLYHLLTGETPVPPQTLRDAGYENMQRLIREQEATAPSTLISRMGSTSTDVAKNRATDPGSLQSSLRGDLDWIVMKALEKDRTRRYETVASMADDVRRHLDNLPVHAGPPSILYKLKKFVRRNRVPVLAGSIAGLALVVGLAAAVAGFLRVRAAAERSQMVSETLQELLVSVDPGQAANHGVDVERLLGRAREAFGEEHATVAATLNNLATQLQNAGDIAGAKPLFQESMALWESIHGRQHASIALTLGHLGELQRLEGDDTAAEKSLREALAILDGLENTPPIAAASIRTEMASLLDERGERTEAIDQLEEVLKIYEVAAGGNHHRLHQAREQMLGLLIAAGRTDRALEVVRDIYDDVRNYYPEDSTFHSTSALGLANLLARTGDEEQAAHFYREALSSMERRPAQNSINRLMALDRLFQIVRHRTDPEGQAEGDALLTEVVEEYRSVWPPKEQVMNIVHLGDRLRSRGKYASALGRSSQALSIAVDARLGPEMTSGLRDKLALDALYIGVDPTQETLAYEQALAAAERLLADEPENAAFATLLGGLLYRLGQPQDALGVLTDAEGASTTRNEQMREAVVPVNAAFEALAAHEVGDTERAQEAALRMNATRSNFVRLEMEHLEPLLQEVLETLDR